MRLVVEDGGCVLYLWDGVLGRDVPTPTVHESDCGGRRPRETEEELEGIR